jgi:hypothetical protein
MERRVPFAQIAIPAWSKLPAALEHGFRKNAVYSVHFALHPDDRKLAPFDVAISNVFFYR